MKNYSQKQLKIFKKQFCKYSWYNDSILELLEELNNEKISVDINEKLSFELDEIYKGNFSINIDNINPNEFQYLTIGEITQLFWEGYLYLSKRMKEFDKKVKDRIEEVMDYIDIKDIWNKDLSYRDFAHRLIQLKKTLKMIKKLDNKGGK